MEACSQEEDLSVRDLEQAQPQLYGTSYFPFRNTPTGHKVRHAILVPSSLPCEREKHLVNKAKSGQVLRPRVIN